MSYKLHLFLRPVWHLLLPSVSTFPLLTIHSISVKKVVDRGSNEKLIEQFAEEQEREHRIIA